MTGQSGREAEAQPTGPAVTGGEVRRVPSSLSPADAATVWVLRRIVGPLRRRLWKVDPLPPPLTGPQIMERLAALPVSHWSYEFEPGVRHLGPMAQDFAAAFGLGRTNRMINPLDEGGVAITAIQALHRRVVALEAEVALLKAAAAELTPDRGD